MTPRSVPTSAKMTTQTQIHLASTLCSLGHICAFCRSLFIMPLRFVISAFDYSSSVNFSHRGAFLRSEPCVRQPELGCGGGMAEDKSSRSRAAGRRARCVGELPSNYEQGSRCGRDACDVHAPTRYPTVARAVRYACDQTAVGTRMQVGVEPSCACQIPMPPLLNDIALWKTDAIGRWLR